MLIDTTIHGHMLVYSPSYRPGSLLHQRCTAVVKQRAASVLHDLVSYAGRPPKDAQLVNMWAESPFHSRDLLESHRRMSWRGLLRRLP